MTKTLEEPNELANTIRALCALTNIDMTTKLHDMVKNHERKKAAAGGQTSDTIINKQVATTYQRICAPTVTWKTLVEFAQILNIGKLEISFKVQLDNNQEIEHVIPMIFEKLD